MKKESSLLKSWMAKSCKVLKEQNFKEKQKEGRISIKKNLFSVSKMRCALFTTLTNLVLQTYFWRYQRHCHWQKNLFQIEMSPFILRALSWWANSQIEKLDRTLGILFMDVSWNLGSHLFVHWTPKFTYLNWWPPLARYHHFLWHFAEKKKTCREVVPPISFFPFSLSSFIGLLLGQLYYMTQNVEL